MSAAMHCAKCGHQAPSRAALDDHFAEAQHWLDPDFQLFTARQRVERLRGIRDAAAVALADAEADLALAQIGA